MNFGKALEAVKDGKKIFRLGWNGKGMFVVYQKGYPDGIPCNLQTAKASVYGEVVTEDEEHGQMTLADVTDLGIFDLGRPLLKTTGCERTGCMFCGYGCHLEKSPGRFERMKITHPKQYEYIMKPWDDGGLGFKEIIDWINEHGNLNIRY